MTGVVLAYVVEPGVGMNIDVKSLDTSALSAYTSHVAQVTNEVDVLMRIIPTTVVDAFAQGDILQVLLFAILFGVGLAMLGEHGRTVTHCIAESVNVLFKVIGLIVKLAPLGALGAVAFTVGKYGVASLERLGHARCSLHHVTAALFVVIVLGGVRLIPLTQAPLYVVSEGGRAWGARFGAPSGGARTHAGGVPERISR